MLKTEFSILALTACLAALPLWAQPAGGTSPIGDGGPAAAATLAWPAGIAVDHSGNVFIAERRGNRIRRVDAATGLIATVAGNGTRDFSGDGGPAQAAGIAIPELIALDAAGNLFIADRGNVRVRRIDAETGILTTLAGGKAAE